MFFDREFFNERAATRKIARTIAGRVKGPLSSPLASSPNARGISSLATNETTVDENGNTMAPGFWNLDDWNHMNWS